MTAPARKAFALRLDPTVWAAIERLASQELRSANAQIEYLLRDALQRRGALPQAPAQLSSVSPSPLSGAGPR